MNQQDKDVSAQRWEQRLSETRDRLERERVELEERVEALRRARNSASDQMDRTWDQAFELGREVGILERSLEALNE